MPKVLLLGSHGLLGSNLARILNSNESFKLVTASRKGHADYNFSYTFSGLVEIIRQVRPDFIINCIAVTSPDSSFKRLIKVNGLLPIQLAFLGFFYEFKTIHFGTNAVFSGHRKRNTEKTIPRPLSQYGLSKLLGDLSSFNSLVIRTSFIGVTANNNQSRGFVCHLHSLPMNARFLIAENYLWNGLTTDILVELTIEVLRLSPFPKGILHLGTQENISRIDLTHNILENLKRPDVDVISKHQGPTRNLSLTSMRVPLIQHLWSNCGYTKVPTFNELISKMEL